VGDPVPYCNYTLPNEQAIVGFTQPPAIVQVNRSAASPDSYFGSGLLAHVVGFTIMRADWKQISDGEDSNSRYYYNLTNANATECGFDYCVKRYNGSVTKTIFTEDVVDTFINTTAYQASGSVETLYITPPASWTEHAGDNEANIFFIDPITYVALQETLFASSSTPSQSMWDGAFFDYSPELSSGKSSTSDLLTILRYLDDEGVKTMMNR
jgi:hypothetical protein